MRFQLHTLQLLPGPERPSYAGQAGEDLEGLDGRLSVRHEGRILATQEAPPSPVFLRNGHQRSVTCSCRALGCPRLGRTVDRDSRSTGLKGGDSRAKDEKDQGAITDSAAAAGKPTAASPAQADLPSEGAMAGDSESQAQGDVAASD